MDTVFKYAVCVFVILLMFAVGPVAYAQSSGNVNLFLGTKALDEDDWAPVEDQTEVGVEFDYRGANWPISIAVDILRSSGDETLGFIKYEGETTEINLGVRKIWESGTYVRPFIGGGLSFASAEATVSILGVSGSEDDSGVGVWLGGGVYWTLGGHFNLGLEAKLSSAEVTIAGVDANAGGGHFGILLGYHW